jgi:DNA-binding MurR/RpiR family transcriptional regulator
LNQIQTWQELQDRIGAQFPTMSRQLRRTARYMLDQPDEVAVSSMRQLATRAGIPPTTFVRLAQSLGLADYDGLRQFFIDRLRDGPNGYASRIRALQSKGEKDEIGALTEHISLQQIKSLETSLAKIDSQVLADSVHLIDKARTVYVVGMRAQYPVAFFFDYLYSAMGRNCVLLGGQAGTFLDPLRDAGSRDCLIAISVAPYARQVIEATYVAAGRRIPIIAITDSPLSPLAAHARHVIEIATLAMSPFHSIMPSLAIVETLLSIVAARGGQKVITAMSARERHLEEIDAYWNDSKGNDRLIGPASPPRRRGSQSSKEGELP